MFKHKKGSRLYQCNKCSKMFTDLESAKNHLKNHEPKRHICQYCGAGYSLLNNLKRHEKLHLIKDGKVEKVKNQDNLYKLPKEKTKIIVREIKFVKQGNIDEEQVQETSAYTCYICHESFAMKKLYRQHLGTHPVTECPICQKPVKPLYIEHHLKIHDPSYKPRKREEKPEICTICGKTIASYSSLKHHMLRHKNEKPISCPHCEKKFVNLSSLKIHEVVHTGSRPYKCDICGNAYSQLSYLGVHKRKHTGERPHKCTLCEKSFMMKTALENHIKNHDLTCLLCNRIFSDSEALETHKQKHELGLSFNQSDKTCKTCGKTFSKLKYLRRHEATHLTIKPYKCSHCDKTFAQKTQMVLHKRHHTGERPYKCNICEETFKFLQNFKNHIKSHIAVN